LQDVPEELCAVSWNLGFWPGSYEFWALRRVRVTALLVQSGRVDPAGSCSLLPPVVVPPLVPPEVVPPPVPLVPEDAVAPPEPPLVVPMSPLPPDEVLPLPPLPPPTDPPGRLLLSGPVAEGPGVIDEAGVWPLFPSAPLLPPPPRELMTQTASKANRATRHSTTARRRQ
jgi:hypothetical protein